MADGCPEAKISYNSSIMDDYAYEYIVEKLKITPPRQYDGYSSYGYEVYLPQILSMFVRERGGLAHNESPDKLNRQHWPAFADAAWRLCLQGILRPGVKQMREQSTEDGSAGNGYSVTSFGRHWLQEQKSTA